VVLWIHNKCEWCYYCVVFVFVLVCVTVCLLLDAMMHDSPAYLRQKIYINQV
jgi:hypothetical protein